MTDWKKIGVITLMLICIIEALTIGFRYGLDIQSSRDTAHTIGNLTGGVRIHHGYIGALVLAGAMFIRNRWRVCRRWLIAIGAALIASDMIHHFLVLWPLEGDPQFHFLYSEYSDTAGSEL